MEKVDVDRISCRVDKEERRPDALTMQQSPRGRRDGKRARGKRKKENTGRRE
jgi:hypothetical protein